MYYIKEQIQQILTLVRILEFILVVVYLLPMLQSQILMVLLLFSNATVTADIQFSFSLVGIRIVIYIQGH